MNEIPEIFKRTDILFHYCKTSVAIENILFEKRLRLTSRNKSIDPIEKTKPQISFAIAAYPEDVEKLEKSTQEVVEKIEQNIKSLIDNTKQVCFCMNNEKIESDEDFGFIKPRMWDQYGDGYKGVCLAFSKKELLKLNNKKKIKKNKVNYLKYKDLKNQYIEIDHNILNEIGYEKYNKELLDYVDKTLFWKHLDYKGENEFRICTLEVKEYDYISIENCIKGIIVSLKDVNPYSLKILRKYSKKMKIDLIDISWNNNSVSYRKDRHIPGQLEIYYS
ncbi:MAG: DUF2971 domain-containing protein [Lutibacter sp.]